MANKQLKLSHRVCCGLLSVRPKKRGVSVQFTENSSILQRAWDACFVAVNYMPHACTAAQEWLALRGPLCGGNAHSIRPVTNTSGKFDGATRDSVSEVREIAPQGDISIFLQR